MKGYHDIVGDGGSRILEQVEAQKARIDDALSGVRHVVAVGSGKGGVGKSTLTLELAAALRARGRDVAILDADFNGPSQARLTGTRAIVPLPGASRAVLPRTPGGIGVFSMGSLVPETDAVDFATLTPDESHTWRATREFAFLGEVLSGFEWGKLDELLIDLPPGAERTFQYAQFLGPSTAFVLVTIPSELARGVVVRSIAALGKTPNRILGYVENMSGYWCEACSEVKPLFPASSSPEVDAPELAIPCLGTVPFDPDLARMSDLGVGLLDRGDGPTARRLAAIARRVIEALEEDAA